MIRVKIFTSMKPNDKLVMHFQWLKQKTWSNLYLILAFFTSIEQGSLMGSSTLQERPPLTTSLQIGWFESQ